MPNVVTPHFACTPRGHQRLAWVRVSDAAGNTLRDYATDADFYAYMVDRPTEPPIVVLFSTQRAMREAILAEEGVRL